MMVQDVPTIPPRTGVSRLRCFEDFYNKLIDLAEPVLLGMLFLTLLKRLLERKPIYYHNNDINSKD
jgi:hypothetical protein